MHAWACSLSSYRLILSLCPTIVNNDRGPSSLVSSSIVLCEVGVRGGGGVGEMVELRVVRVCMGRVGIN